jgi:hypothetical protein
MICSTQRPGEEHFTTLRLSLDDEKDATAEFIDQIHVTGELGFLAKPAQSNIRP